MLTQPLLDKLGQLGLSGFRTALEEQMESAHYANSPLKNGSACSWTSKSRAAPTIASSGGSEPHSFPIQATVEDLDLSPRRGLKRAEVLKLTHGEWIGHHLNLLVLGPTGAGKSYLASALGRAACQAEYTVRYERTSRLLQTLELARADGSYAQLLQKLARIRLLIFDDWLRDPLSRSQARDLLEILDDRYGRNCHHGRHPDPGCPVA